MSQDAMPQSAMSAEDLLRATTNAQYDASDPKASAWVGANAGAGKTHVLKMRVLRLLLAGVAPERILCLTYTKAAAAEMAQRVFRELAGWSTMAPASLHEELEVLFGRTASDDEAIAARQLFARAIETPGGLKVQTIHAFCERLLQRFPLEANVPPGFTILDDATAAGLLRDAVDDALIAANAAPNGPMGQAVRAAVAFAADDQFDKVLAEALRKRDWISELSRLGAKRGDEEPIAAIRALYLEAFDVDEADTETDLTERMAGVLSDAQLQAAARLLLAGSKNDVKLGHSVHSAYAAEGAEQRGRALEAVFLTSGKARSDNFITKASREAEPGLCDAMLSAKSEFAGLFDLRRRRRIADATVALLTIAERVMAHYTNAKSQRAALDFDDLIGHAAGLLDQSNAAAWVLYKLDGGLDHVLVDEAQDTSPIQWRVIEQLVGEFYAGAGVREEAGGQTGDGARSVFAVGDEKQSIYSFQGAAPEMFARTGKQFYDRARVAEQTFKRVPLELSFRTVEPLLKAVDHVFSDHSRTPGLSASAEAIQHLALRQGQAGLFELWDTEAVEEVKAAPAFAPLEELPVSSPITRLAERIAAQVADWLVRGELLESQDRPIRASDILVLVRKRQPFAGEMVRALKRRQIPVAGADRIVLGEHIAVQDLMALADFLLLPEDDLALANVLKSPLFNLDDDDLLRFAPERPGLLWTALLASAKTDTALEPAAAQLKRWRAQADFSPPFEFFANLLDRDGGRARLLGRLGPEAADAIDEFVNLALNYDEQAPPSLQGFVTWLRTGRREIKRDMEHGRNEVRVMTVHGSKGLEAPIVFLPDTCSAPGAGQQSPLVALNDRDRLRPGLNEVFAWAVKGASKSERVEAARATEKAAALEEHNRLLYVAMTRARDRLYVGGFEGKNGIASGSWYETIEAGLDGQLTETHDAAGHRVRQLRSHQSAPHDRASDHAATSAMPAPLPAWALQAAPKEPVFTVPLTPSRISTLETDDEGEWAALSDIRDRMLPPLEPPSQSPLYLARDDRLLRGTITHALLEHLPNVEPAKRERTAQSFVKARGPELPASVHAAIVAEAMNIISDPQFGEAFGPQSRAEVAVVANVAHPNGIGPTLRVNGQIDRLVRRNKSLLIVDYKSNRRPPASAEAASQAYLLQLAAYRIAVQQIFPGDSVEAAFLWTDGPLLMPVPAALLDTVEPKLWEVAT